MNMNLSIWTHKHLSLTLQLNSGEPLNDNQIHLYVTCPIQVNKSAYWSQKWVAHRRNSEVSLQKNTWSCKCCISTVPSDVDERRILQQMERITHWVLASVQHHNQFQCKFLINTSTQELNNVKLKLPDVMSKSMFLTNLAGSKSLKSTTKSFKDGSVAS